VIDRSSGGFRTAFEQVVGDLLERCFRIGQRSRSITVQSLTSKAWDLVVSSEAISEATSRAGGQVEQRRSEKLT
jgi:hypothetical protein